MAGYPIVNVLGGYSFGFLPVGISFMGTAFSEAKLIKLAYSFERHAPRRKPPTFLPSLPLPTHARLKSLGFENVLDRLSSIPKARPFLRHL